ncbi:flavin-binding monooxygenase [Aspergillus sclerotioniger CBS 115572]|uniref:Flavin-binding monooxygenase n=1 Tax=Aspergillus sclerotioniger CBS 115572 TaxID=1450535 RepID=A0A317V2K8_9EURO|nr:flavin-binding monooxygenase [Aspergillus sclerotioniger CBS 115572]PWY67601.1 flavin-binding monooxygenase [Aspergillus sclerotioniger CBS 115572]
MSSKASQHVGNNRFTRSTVVIVGAGISGICMAIDLLRRTPTRNIIILEKGSRVGGTWADNRYPGAACDVRSSLYSFSFEQCPTWTEEFPRQKELLEYLTDIAQKYGLYRYIRFNSMVQEARWDDSQLQWKVQVALTGAKDSQFQEAYEITTDFLISAVGQLNIPSYPRIPGLDDFTGKMMHSARWDWGYDFADKRVAVIGSGATAAQIVPEMAKTVSHLTVYQRTPNWIFLRGNKPVSAMERFLLTYVPLVRWCKRAMIMRIREWSYSPVTNPESGTAHQVKEWALARMRSNLPDKPDLWEALTPKYSFGCKRVLFCDDYYPTLNSSHVDLETRSIQRITATGIQTEGDGNQDYDLIVLASGFRASEFLQPIKIYGSHGRPLEDIWKGGATAYRGVVAEDLPNFGMLYGPNTNLGHNSIILMIEAQSKYLSTLVGAVVESKEKGQSLALQPRPDVVREYNERIQDRLSKTSFADPSCRSWYKTKDGRITNNWPGTVVEYQEQMSQLQWTDYLIQGTGAEFMKKKKAACIARVKEEMPVSTTTLVLGLVMVAGGCYLRTTRGWR